MAFDRAKTLLGDHPARFELWCGLELRDHHQPDFTTRVVAELVRCHQAGARGVGEGRLELLQ